MEKDFVSDIKNSLTVIIGFSQLIKEGRNPSKYDSYCNIIIEESEGILKILESLEKE